MSFYIPNSVVALLEGHKRRIYTGRLSHAHRVGPVGCAIRVGVLEDLGYTAGPGRGRKPGACSTLP